MKRLVPVMICLLVLGVAVAVVPTLAVVKTATIEGDYIVQGKVNVTISSPRLFNVDINVVRNQFVSDVFDFSSGTITTQSGGQIGTYTVSKKGVLTVDTKDVVSELEAAFGNEFPDTTVNVTAQSFTIKPDGSAKFTGQLKVHMNIVQTIENQRIPVIVKISIAFYGQQTTGSAFVAAQDKNPVDTVSNFIKNKIVKDIASRIQMN